MATSTALPSSRRFFLCLHRYHALQGPVAVRSRNNSSSSSSTPYDNLLQACRQHSPLQLSAALPSSPEKRSSRWLQKQPRIERHLRHFTTSSLSRDRGAEAVAPTDTTDTISPPSSQLQTPKSPPPPPQTHYDLFPKSLPLGAPPKGPFAIDLNRLRNEFLRLQAAAHPDLHAPVDKRRAEALSSRINDAYRTLQHPLARAQYLLGLRGIDVAEDETARLTVEDDNNTADLLMEVLEAREMIEEAGSEEELEPLMRENGERIVDSVAALDEAFRVDDMERARSEAVRLRYWTNIRESLNDWEPGKPVVLHH